MITGIFEPRPTRLTMNRVQHLRAFPLSFHAHVELFYIHSGQMTLRVDGRPIVLHEGDLSVCFPYMLHQSETECNADVTLLLFEPSLCGSLLNILGSCKPECPHLRRESVPPIVPELLSSLLALVRKNTAEDPAIPAYLTVLLTELLDRLTLIPLPMTELSLTQQVLTYCMVHYRSDLTLDKVAQALFLRKSQVTRIFQRLDMSFRDYLNQLRIHAACRLLIQSNMSVTDIVYESGFNNQGTFNRLFLKICGITPSEYRAQHASEPPSL